MPSRSVDRTGAWEPRTDRYLTEPRKRLCRAGFSGPGGASRAGLTPPAATSSRASAPSTISGSGTRRRARVVDLVGDARQASSGEASGRAAAWSSSWSRVVDPFVPSPPSVFVGRLRRRGGTRRVRRDLRPVLPQLAPSRSAARGGCRRARSSRSARRPAGASARPVAMERVGVVDPAVVPVVQQRLPARRRGGRRDAAARRQPRAASAARPMPSDGSAVSCSAPRSAGEPTAAAVRLLCAGRVQSGADGSFAIRWVIGDLPSPHRFFSPVSHCSSAAARVTVRSSGSARARSCDRRAAAARSASRAAGWRSCRSPRSPCGARCRSAGRVSRTARGTTQTAPLLYALFAALGLWAAARTRALAHGLAALLGAVIVWSLLGKVLPFLYDYGGPDVTRLRGPIGLWNQLALATDFALALALCASRPRGHAARVFGARRAPPHVLARRHPDRGARVRRVVRASRTSARERRDAGRRGAARGRRRSGSRFALPGVTSDGQSLHVRWRDGLVFGALLVVGAVVALRARAPAAAERHARAAPRR